MLLDECANGNPENELNQIKRPEILEKISDEQEDINVLDQQQNLIFNEETNVDHTNNLFCETSS